MFSLLPKINNPELSNILVEANILFDDKSYFQAAKKILEAINLNNAVEIQIAT